MVKTTIRPATREDATHLACFVDMASEGLALHLWETMKGPGQTLFEVGRSRALREDGWFSFRNSHMAEVDMAVGGALVGYKIAEVHDHEYRRGGDKDAPPLPAFIKSLVELEAMVPGHWYVNILATYPEYRGQESARLCSCTPKGLGLTTAARGMAVIVASENSKARQLYESVGYTEKASRPLVAFQGFHHGGEWLLLTKAS